MTSSYIFSKALRGKTVLITGHTGFIGSWLSLWLHLLGVKVIGFSLEPPTNPSMFEVVELSKYVVHNIGDVKDSNHFTECLIHHKPEVVFHLAAQPLVMTSYQNPVETFRTNIMGVVNVLEGIRNTNSVRACVIMTSDKCYRNDEKTDAYKENDPMGGHDPYSGSKGAAELVTSAYRNSFFNPNDIEKHKVSIATIRAGNVIGGGDWARDRIVPDCIHSLMSKQSVALRHPKAIRPWQHVLEPLSGLLCLTAKMMENLATYGEAWNFGPSHSSKVTVEELVTQVIKQWGSGNWTSDKTHSSFHESNYLMLDSSKAMNLLGWQPVYSLNEAVSETISWYKAYASATTQMNDFTITQIQKYIKKAKQMNISWADDLV